MVSLDMINIRQIIPYNIQQQKTLKQKIQQIIHNDFLDFYEKQFTVQEEAVQESIQENIKENYSQNIEEEISDDIPYKQSIIKCKPKIQVQELILSVIKKKGKQFSGANEAPDCSEVQSERISRYKQEIQGISNVIQYIFISGDSPIIAKQPCQKLNIQQVISLSQLPENNCKGLMYVQAKERLKSVIKPLSKSAMNRSQSVVNVNEDDYVVNIVSCNIADISSTSLSVYIYELLYMLVQSIKYQTNTVIQCDEGVSRSSSVILMLLMVIYNTSYREAFTYTRLKRRIIRPNFGFITQILEWDQWRHNCEKKSIKTQAVSNFLKKYLNISDDLNAPLDSYKIKQQQGFKIGQNESKYPKDDEIKDVVNNICYDPHTIFENENWLFRIKYNHILDIYTVQKTSIDCFHDFLIRNKIEKERRQQTRQCTKTPNREFLFTKKQTEKQPDPIDSLDDIYLSVFNGDFIYLILDEYFVIEYQLSLSLTQKVVKYDQNYLFQNLDIGIEKTPCYKILKDQFMHQIYHGRLTPCMMHNIIRSISLFVLFEGVQPNLILISQGVAKVTNITPQHQYAASLFQQNNQGVENDASDDLTINQLYNKSPYASPMYIRDQYHSQINMEQTSFSQQKGRISLRRLPKRLSRLVPIINNFNAYDNSEVVEQNKWLDNMEKIEDI